MSEWREVTLGDVVELKRGYDLPSADRREGTVPIVSSSGRTGFHDEAKVRGPGVVTGRYGTLGAVFYIEEDFWPLNTALYVRDFKGNHPKFVAALLASLDLGRSEGAAAVPGVNRNHLHVLPVTVPDPETQSQIAEILGAVDDLIENNRRRIAMLEGMAQAIYREWFVHFRYPGHKDDELVDSGSPLGPIPAGWSTSDVGSEALNFDRLRKPLSRRERSERPGTLPYYGAARVIDSIDDYLFDGDYLLVAEDGSVITDDGFPILQRVRGQFWVSNHAHVLQGAGRVTTSFLELALGRYPIVAHVTGAAQPKVTQENLNRIDLLVPRPSELAAFSKAVEPVVDERFVLGETCRVLELTRDLLLPRLVTGAIDVSHLDLDGLAEVSAA